MGAAILLVLLLPLQLLGLIGVPWLARNVPVLFHRILLKLFGVRVRLKGRLSPGRPLMIVANHVSWLDIVVLSSVAPLSFVAKAEMASWPLFGQLAKLQRTIFIKREDRRRSGHQASEISSRLLAGDIMVLFPEGTTSDGHGLYPFKTPLFEAARMALVDSGRESATIQPIAIDYKALHGLPIGRQFRQHVAWPGDVGLGEHFVPLVSEGALDVVLHLEKPIELKADANRKVVAARARESIEQALERKLS